jgi:hypothetical protein
MPVTLHMNVARNVPHSIAREYRCSLCQQERPPQTPPELWSRLKVGFTSGNRALQIWCSRHNLNVAYIAFTEEDVPPVHTLNG